MIDSFLILFWYNFFADPLNMDWRLKHGLFYSTFTIGFLPHFLYVRGLQKKIYKIFLMRGGKYCKIEYMDFYGVCIK
jgi:hypothetical protein